MSFEFCSFWFSVQSWHTFGMGLRVWLAMLVAVGAGWVAAAQEPAQQDGPIHTLRVFTNLIQIPTLVLDDRGYPVEEKTHPKFLVTLDGGKPFAPTHVRLQGEDPISLGVLLDASGGQRDLLSGMDYELAAMAGGGELKPRDHVTIYAIDCKTVRTLADGPADKAALKAAVKEALQTPELHGPKHQHDCASTLALRDAAFQLATEMGPLPGRRVLLLVTAGTDAGSQHTWQQVRKAAQRYRLTVFGLHSAGAPSVLRSAGHGPPAVAVNVPGTPDADLSFQALCENTGGATFTANDTTLRNKLTEFLKMLRGRYIVEFPRQDALGSGAHLLQVTVPGKEYIIRPSEAMVPVADPRLKGDPTVLQPGAQPGAPADMVPVPETPKLPPEETPHFR